MRYTKTIIFDVNISFKIMIRKNMSVYLETNALRKLTSYKCEKPAYTSVFSIFELGSGITEKDYEIRKACLRWIKEQRIEIKGPIVDQSFANLVGITDESAYNKFACQMIMDLFDAVLETENYSVFSNIVLLTTDENNKEKKNPCSYLVKKLG